MSTGTITGNASLQISIDNLININGKPAVQTAVNNSTAPGPVAPPVNQIAAFGLGMNFAATDDPEMVGGCAMATYKDLKVVAARSWLEGGPLGNAIPDAKWNNPRKLKAMGMKNCVVLQLRYAKIPLKPMPAEGTAFAASIPPSSQTGVDVIECNEIDGDGYNQLSRNDFTTFFVALAIGLIAKGYRPALSVSRDISWFTDLETLGALQYATGGVCHHCYDSTWQAAQGEYIALEKELADPPISDPSINQDVTECALHGGTATNPASQAQITGLYKFRKTRPWISYYFCFAAGKPGQPVHSADWCALFRYNPDGTLNTAPTPMYAALKSGIA